jgi:predicted ATPase
MDHVRRGLDLYDPVKHRHHALTYGGHDPGVCGKSQHGVAFWALGYPDRALQSALDSVALSEKLDHLPSALHALWFVVTAHFLRRDAAATAECGERLLSLAREHGMRLLEAFGGTFHAWALCQLHGGDEAIARLRAYFQQWKATSPVMLDLGSASLAEAELRAGNFDRAATALDEAAALDLGWWEAEISRLRGDLALAGLRTDRKDAEHWYRRAIEVAQRQKAKSLELRAAMALARLWAEQGRRAEAYDLLAPLYGWFTEGFDTLDLKEAKALLDELAA